MVAEKVTSVPCATVPPFDNPLGEVTETVPAALALVVTKVEPLLVESLLPQITVFGVAVVVTVAVAVPARNSSAVPSVTIEVNVAEPVVGNAA